MMRGKISLLKILIENHWGFKYSGKNENKMKKCYHFFVFLLK